MDDAAPSGGAATSGSTVANVHEAAPLGGVEKKRRKRKLEDTTLAPTPGTDDIALAEAWGLDRMTSAGFDRKEF